MKSINYNPGIANALIKIQDLPIGQQVNITDLDFTELPFITEIMRTEPEMVTEEEERPLKRVWRSAGVQIVQKYEYWFPRAHSKNFALKSSSTFIKKTE